jgi:hypothetical protein
MELHFPDAIRKAVAAGEFKPALALWRAYAAGLSEQARRGELTESTVTEVGELLRWVKTVTVMARARALEEIGEERAACGVARAYSDVPA